MMYKIIAPTLFQQKVCRLPGIGSLVMETRAAEIDFPNSLIHAPREEVHFYPEAVSEENTFNEFSAMSEIIRQELTENGSLFLQGIGSFHQADNSEIKFRAAPLDHDFLSVVPLERVIRPDSLHAVLVGERQTNNHEIANHLTPAPVHRKIWLLVAAGLAVLAIGVIAFYLYRHGINAFGSQLPF